MRCRHARFASVYVCVCTLRRAAAAAADARISCGGRVLALLAVYMVRLAASAHFLYVYVRFDALLLRLQCKARVFCKFVCALCHAAAMQFKPRAATAAAVAAADDNNNNTDALRDVHTFSSHA